MRCNGAVRFDAMLELAERLGAARLATGHYARIARDEHGPLIRAAHDPRKDQSYMLARLDPARCSTGSRSRSAASPRTRCARSRAMPGCRSPTSARARTSASWPGSAGAPSCAATAARACARPGEIVDAAGRVLGRHDGQHEFTVGQRRGLNLGAPEPLYVLRKDAATNRVTVGPRAALATRSVRLEDARLHRPAGGRRARAAALPRARRSPAARGPRRAARSSSSWREPADAAAPGQLACLMRDDCVVGEGTIA